MPSRFHVCRREDKRGTKPTTDTPDKTLGTFERLESRVRGYCRAFPTVFTRAEGPVLYDEREIEVLPDGPTYAITPGMMYALDGHELHVLRAKTDLRLVCVFNPPCTGREVHDDDGAYPLVEEASAS